MRGVKAKTIRKVLRSFGVAVGDASYERDAKGVLRLSPGCGRDQYRDAKRQEKRA